MAKKKTTPKGLGDTIEQITEVTGVKKLVKDLFGDDCGCNERKDMLNKLFPYKKSDNCLSEEDYKYLGEFFKTKREKLTTYEQNKLLKIYNSIFTDKRRFTTCGSCAREVYETLEKVYSEYNEYM